jgi:TrmH family RNA methyltransferase
MLANEELGRVCVVLVRARNPNNIGAVARAMHDFGFRDLRLVTEYPVPLAEARSAVDASAVLETARSFASVAEAVADCTLVVGTTAVGNRRQEHRLYSLAEAGGELRAAAGKEAGRVAILFGSEKTGLSREELSHCHWLLTIPMQVYEGERHASMNLGQAAAVCLYELVRSAGAFPRAASVRAGADELERLTQLWMAALRASGYDKRHPANYDEVHLRQLVLRMGLNPADAALWTGMVRQLLWKLRSEEAEG